MKILIHSNAPWVPSGYGQQCRLVAGLLRDLGHQVAISAFYGLAGDIIEWQGFPVLPAGQLGYGLDVLVPHARTWGADLVLTLMDFWQLGPIAEQLRELNVAAWVPVDCEPLSRMDHGALKMSGARPIAMSRFGADVLRKAGHDPLWVPHAHDIGQAEYEKLQENRARYREGMGIADRFVIGICAANNDHLRKGFPEQFEAFRRFHAQHPESLLMIHSIAKTGRGLDLVELAHGIGLDSGSVRISDSYAQLAGAFDNEMMRDWYSVLDVLSAASYAEAFGVPLIEAQACGTPVIATTGSAMTENAGPNPLLVASDPFWNHAHQAWWRRPSIRGLARRYRQAYDEAGRRREAARGFAEDFHIGSEMIMSQWAGVLSELEPKGCE